MCGFFGFAGDCDRSRSIDLDAALAALRHRGPDDRGIFSSIERSGNRAFEQSPFCVLAHTRLSIIDLSPAAPSATWPSTPGLSYSSTPGTSSTRPRSPARSSGRDGREGKVEAGI